MKICPSFQFVPVAVGIAAVVVTAVLAKFLLTDKSKKKKNPITLVGKNILFHSSFLNSCVSTKGGGEGIKTLNDNSFECLESCSD